MLFLATSGILADDSESADSYVSALHESLADAFHSLDPRCVSDGIIGIVSGNSASETDHVASALRANFISLRTEIIAAPRDVVDWDLFDDVRSQLKRSSVLVDSSSVSAL